MSKVMVLIVTFNRKNYLLNLLSSLQKQTSKIDSILIIDNYSTDNTAECLIEKGIIKEYEELKLTRSMWDDIEVLYYRNNVNSGGSGGFNIGTTLALKEENDYLWIMDDDVLPEKDCLKNLLDNITDEFKVCIPNRTTEGFVDEPIIALNWDDKRRPCGIKTYDKNYKNKKGVEVCDMPFEGPLMHYDVLKNVGPSDEKYFIFFDDSDYAQRCLEHTKIFFVTDAILNKQIIPKTNVADFSWRDYYFIRNDIIFDKKYNKKKMLPYIRATILCVTRVLTSVKHKNPKACKYILKAYVDGICNKSGKTVEPGSF